VVQNALVETISEAAMIEPIREQLRELVAKLHEKADINEAKHYEGPAYVSQAQRAIAFELEALLGAMPQAQPEGLVGEAAEILDDMLINEECGCAKGKYTRPCPRCKVTLDEAREFLQRIGYQGYVDPGRSECRRPWLRDDEQGS
jgi:hypothetical protein